MLAVVFVPRRSRVVWTPGMPPKRKDSRRNRDAPALSPSDYAAQKPMSNEWGGRKAKGSNLGGVVINVDEDSMELPSKSSSIEIGNRRVIIWLGVFSFLRVWNE